MKVLITGADSYLGSRLVRKLLATSDTVVACVKDKASLELGLLNSKKHSLEIIEADLLSSTKHRIFPLDIDVAYYFSQTSTDAKGCVKKEEEEALNFVFYINQTNVKQIVYLNHLCDHLSSYESKFTTDELSHNVLKSLRGANASITVLDADIIIGKGNPAFEMIRDLVDKLPIMIVPKWITARVCPVALVDALNYLETIRGHEKTFNNCYHVKGSGCLSYLQMLLGYAEIQGIKRKIFIMPVMAVAVSRVWLSMFTKATSNLALTVVQTLKQYNKLSYSSFGDIYSVQPLNYRQSVQAALFADDEKRYVLNNRKLELGFVGFKSTTKCAVKSFKATNRAVISRLQSYTLEKLLFYVNQDSDKHLMNCWLRFTYCLISFLFGVNVSNRTLKLKKGMRIGRWTVLRIDEGNRILEFFTKFKKNGSMQVDYVFNSRYGEDKVLVEQVVEFKSESVIGEWYWRFNSVRFSFFMNLLTFFAKNNLIKS